ncbi:hypothetical protein ACFVMC_28780 [Nocardia sp. NPDC127579]|uniref:hypothetical protein n=1 Tax=Nocardia sp. NPDC127579 TaxID=3345402 RepID=UPI00362CF0DF
MKPLLAISAIAVGVLSATSTAAPAGAAPDIDTGTCQNWSVIPDNIKSAILTELMKTRTGHALADQPDVLLKKVDVGCEVAEKNGSASTLKVSEIIDELDR